MQNDTFLKEFSKKLTQNIKKRKRFVQKLYERDEIVCDRRDDFARVIPCEKMFNCINVTVFFFLDY